MFEIMVEGSFDAAHCLRGYGGNCEKLHGHTYKVQCFLTRSDLDDLGMLADFRVVRKALDDAISDFDHSFLNDLPEFATENPTAENLAKVIYLRLKAAIEKPFVDHPLATNESDNRSEENAGRTQLQPNPSLLAKKENLGIRVARVTVWETASSAASYYEEG